MLLASQRYDTSYNKDFEQILSKYGLTEQTTGDGNTSSNKTGVTVAPTPTLFVKPQECVEKLPRARTLYVTHAQTHVS